MATLEQAADQMLASGMPNFPDGFPRVAGRIVRYGPKKRAWYVLYDFQARNGQRFISGAFGCYGLIDSTKIDSKLDGIPQDELEALRRSQAERERMEVQKRARLASYAGGRAREQWDNATRMPAKGERNAYLERKRLGPVSGLRFDREGTLLVPMIRYDVTEQQMQDPEYTGPRRLVGLQKIAPDGSKRFNKGMAKEGSACRLGKVKPKNGELIALGEGLATVLSCLKALDEQIPAYVAFDAGNLLPVARILRKLYPDSPILFLADDDAYLEAQFNKRLRDDFGIAERYSVADGERTFGSDFLKVPCKVAASISEDERGVAGLAGVVRWIENAGKDGALEMVERERFLPCANAGRLKANAAAAEIGNAWVACPIFAERQLSTDPDAPRLTDFNDLHVVEGIEPVRAQLRVALGVLKQGAAIPAKAPDENAIQFPKRGAKAKKAEPPKDPGIFDYLLKRYAFLYPSNTAFDFEIGQIVKLDHVYLLHGKGLFNWWMDSPDRRVVALQDVVFDPSERADPEKTINLFRGFKLKPSPEPGCKRLLGLLTFLCGEEGVEVKGDLVAHPPITDWVLKWAAYPLQHPGAKMQSAVVMFGKEGTGKNLFWGAVADIYGDYAGLITQMQLQSQFNTWLSAKLFLVANEVVTRHEMRHHIGNLKNLITEPRIYINRKMVDERYEANHANIAFLSNEFQPLQINPGDRRYMVIKTPAGKALEYYAAVSEEIRAGGAAALYRYLLDLDLSDFSVHTRPIQTEAKDELIQLGMTSAQLFWQELHDGMLGLPYCSALANDVFRAYLTWCGRNNEKQPKSNNRFKTEFMSMNGVRWTRQRVPDPDSATEQKTLNRSALNPRSVYVIGVDHALPQERLIAEIYQSACRFRAALKRYAAPANGADEEDSQRYG